MQQRFLNPTVLAGISDLQLVAKTVVDGFISGLHRSPDFGFSQEFAEYRMYTQGDDLRHVDWNVYARTERVYLKRYRGETNTQIIQMIDTSGSMGFTSIGVTKLDYAKYLAASISYLSHVQRDAAGVIIFDDTVRNYVAPSTRQGQLNRCLHAIEEATLGKRTDFTTPFFHFQQFLHRRGIVVVISDFFQKPEDIIHTVEPLRFKGNEVILFHILDPRELRPALKDPALLIDLETGDTMEVTPEYAATDYRQRIENHVETLRAKAQSSGIDYFLMPSDRPLDAGLREYLTIRQGRK